MNNFPQPRPELPAVKTLTLRIEPNNDAEPLSCIVCCRGEDSPRPPEWRVFTRSYNASITMGLHETCRNRTAKLAGGG